MKTKIILHCNKTFQYNNNNKCLHALNIKKKLSEVLKILYEALTLFKDNSRINPIIDYDEITVYTALDYAAYHGKIEIVKAISGFLLDINPHLKYSSIKYQNQYQAILDNNNNTSGFTPLHHAAGKGHLTIVQYFTSTSILVK